MQLMKSYHKFNLPWEYAHPIPSHKSRWHHPQTLPFLYINCRRDFFKFTSARHLNKHDDSFRCNIKSHSYIKHTHYTSSHTNKVHHLWSWTTVLIDWFICHSHTNMLRNSLFITQLLTWVCKIIQIYLEKALLLWIGFTKYYWVIKSSAQ